MRLYWVDTPAGRLATAPAPSGSGLDREVGDLVRDEVAIVLSLLTTEEIASMSLHQVGRTLEAAGITFRNLPIPDFGIPDTYDEADDTISELTDALREGRSVVVHCRGGIGRSSTIAAAILTQLGVAPEDAMSRITAARGITVPETSAQRMWVAAYAKWVNGNE